MSTNMLELEKARLLFAVSDTILSIADLVAKGVPLTFQDLLLPSLASTFGPAIVLSSLFGPLVITKTTVLTYAIGFFIALYFNSNKLLFPLLVQLQKVSKTLSAIKLISSPAETSDIVFEQMVKFFTGTIIKKIVLKRTLKIKRVDIINIALFCGGICLIRDLKLPKGLIVISIYLVPVYNQAKRCISWTKKGETDQSITRRSKQPSILATPASKMPRRKASVSNQIKNNSK